MLPDLTSCGYHKDTCVLTAQHPELRAVRLCDGGSSDHVSIAPICSGTALSMWSDRAPWGWVHAAVPWPPVSAVPARLSVLYRLNSSADKLLTPQPLVALALLRCKGPPCPPGGRRCTPCLPKVFEAFASDLPFVFRAARPKLCCLCPEVVQNTGGQLSWSDLSLPHAVSLVTCPLLSRLSHRPHTVPGAALACVLGPDLVSRSGPPSSLLGGRLALLFPLPPPCLHSTRPTSGRLWFFGKPFALNPRQWKRKICVLWGRTWRKREVASTPGGTWPHLCPPAMLRSGTRENTDLSWKHLCC